MWGDSQRITHIERNVSGPQVVFIGPDRALAMWAQNKLTREAGREAEIDTILANQDLHYSLWDGSTWSAPARLTDNNAGDGAISLASDPANGQALAVWVQDTDGSPDTGGDADIFYALWDGTGWSPPSRIAPDPVGADYLPTVAYDHAGHAMAVWVKDADADPADLSDRMLVSSEWNGTSWSAPVPLDMLPAGATQPSLAFDANNQPLIAFVVPDDLQAMVGNRGFLWYAYQRNANWEVGSIGTGVRAETPEVSIHDGQAQVIVRRLGESTSVHFDGEVALTSADLSQTPLVWSPVGLLTEQGGRNWWVASSVDPKTGDAHILHVHETGGGTSETTAVIPSAMLLDNVSDAVVIYNLAQEPDLTVDGLAFSSPHPLNSTVVLSATIRNRGLAASGPFTVRFVQGDPEWGNVIANVAVAGMGAQITRTVTTEWAASASVHDIYAIVDTEDDVLEADETNNETSEQIGTPPAPQFLQATELRPGDRILLRWDPPEEGNIVGYRIYRATTSGGPYQLIALAMDTFYEDWYDVTVGQTYYYVVAAYDEANAISAYSNESRATLPLYRLHMPMMAKNGS